MKRLFLVIVSACSFYNLVGAFTVPRANSMQRFSSSSLCSEATTVSAVSTFDGFQSGITREIVWKDIIMGANEDGAKDQDVLVVNYKGTIMSSGKTFNSGNDFSFQIGKGQSLPGFEEGLLGVTSGTTRKLRVPPNKAYGAQGTYDGRIPPNADLEFEVEVKRVVSNEKSPLLAQLALFGELRLLGIVGCVGVLALPPLF
jgi:FKBP-type peptidyl-prolyl cis-trans isomerase